MKLFKTMLACMLVLTLALTGCTASPAESEPSNNVALTDPAEKAEDKPAETPAAENKLTNDAEPAPASIDELLAAAGLTEEELPGVDLAAFISEEQLTADMLKQLPPETIKEALLALVVPETTSFAYLIHGEAIIPEKGTGIDMDQVTRIAVVSANDALIPSLLIDLDAGKAYYADGFFLEDIDSAAKVTDLTAELRNEVAAAVEAAGIDTWEACYTDSADAQASQDAFYYTAAANWVIAFETADGVVRYSVNGVEPDAPEEFFALGISLYNLFW